MDFFLSYPISVPLVAVLFAEILKVLFDSCRKRRFCTKNFFHSGGMPSGHSALVGSLVSVVYMIEGVQSIAFTITGIFALIVMYDAINIRMEAGKHAKVLNILQKKEKFDELLGHTFSQVVAGFIFGSMISLALLV